MMNVNAMDIIEKNYNDSKKKSKNTIDSTESTNSDTVDIVDSPESFKLLNHRIILDAAVVGVLAYILTSGMIDTMLYDIAPRVFDHDDRGNRKISSTGKIIKILIISVLYILIELYVLPSDI